MRVQFVATVILGLTLIPVHVFWLYVRCTNSAGQDYVRIGGAE
jgi:hypothetical protein